MNKGNLYIQKPYAEIKEIDIEKKMRTWCECIAECTRQRSFSKFVQTN